MALAEQRADGRPGGRVEGWVESWLEDPADEWVDPVLEPVGAPPTADGEVGRAGRAGGRAGSVHLPDRSPGARAALARVAERTRPSALARQRALPVLPALAGLLPDGLRRGSTVVVEPGPGATTLAVALVAAASADGSWVAAVGVPSLGLAGAVELGMAPERLLLVDLDLDLDLDSSSRVEPHGGRGRSPVTAATVVAALVDAVDVVVLGARVSPAEARRLAARAREQGAVVVALPGRWPGVADLRVRVGGATWELPHRRLVARRVEVTVAGRGAAARPRRCPLWLPAPDGAVAVVDAEPGGDATAPRAGWARPGGPVAAVAG